MNCRALKAEAEILVNFNWLDDRDGKAVDFLSVKEAAVGLIPPFARYLLVFVYSNVSPAVNRRTNKEG